MTKPDIIDNLADRLLNPLLSILKSIKDIEEGWKSYQQALRECPYRGKRDAKCRKVQNVPFKKPKNT